MSTSLGVGWTLGRKCSKRGGGEYRLLAPSQVVSDVRKAPSVSRDLGGWGGGGWKWKKTTWKCSKWAKLAFEKPLFPATVSRRQAQGICGGPEWGSGHGEAWEMLPAGLCAHKVGQLLTSSSVRAFYGSVSHRDLNLCVFCHLQAIFQL